MNACSTCPGAVSDRPATTPVAWPRRHRPPARPGPTARRHGPAPVGPRRRRRPGAAAAATALLAATGLAAHAGDAADERSVSGLLQLSATHARYGDYLGADAADADVAELRIDASARGGGWAAVLRPRARLRRVDTALPAYTQPRRASLTEAYASVDATASLQLTLGKRYLAWGPGLLYSPSNRLFPDNGSASPRQEIDGKPLAMATATVAGLQAAVLVADPYLQHDAALDRRGPFVLARVEHVASGGAEPGWGLIAAGGAGLRPYAGGYGQVTLGDAVTLAFEGSASRGYASTVAATAGLAQDERRLRGDAAVSLRYGLASGGEWGVEVIDNGYHLTPAEQQDPRIALLPPSASTQSRYAARHPLPERRYLDLQLNLPRLWGRSRWTLFLRHLEALDGRGRLTFAELGYGAGDRVTLYLGLTATSGRATSSLVRTLGRAAYAAAELNF